MLYVRRIVARYYGARVLLWWADGTCEVRLRSGRVITVPATIGNIRVAHEDDQRDRKGREAESLAVLD
jgi:uncharacterized protein YjlB